MKDRLLQLLTSENMTALKFAEIMEIRPSNVSHILSGRNNPNFDFIARLLRRFPELSPDWVLNGDGDMYRVGFKHDFSAMGDEGLDADTTVTTLFSDDIPDTPVTSFVNPAPNIAEMPSNVPSGKQVPATSYSSEPAAPTSPSTAQSANIPLSTPSANNITSAHVDQMGDPAVSTEPLNTTSAEKSAERLILNDAQQTKKLVIIYADNTFEVLTPKPR